MDDEAIQSLANGGYYSPAVSFPVGEVRLRSLSSTDEADVVARFIERF
jgi:hypothetical protein